MNHRKVIATIISTSALAFSVQLPVLAADGRTGNTSSSLSGTALDAVINGKVAAALMSDPGLSGSRIEIDTHDGIVSLRGEVSGPRETRRALELVASVDGVRRVDNLLELASDQ